MKRPSETEYHLLILLRNRAGDGRELLERLRHLTGKIMRNGTLHVLLSRMEKNGWVRSKAQAAVQGRRTIYSFTRTGEKVLLQEQRNFSTLIRAWFNTIA